MTLTDAKPAFDRYVNHGILPGSFLRAILENNLTNAISHGDKESLENLGEIVSHVHCQLRGDCHGSKENVRDWVSKFYEGKK